MRLFKYGGALTLAASILFTGCSESENPISSTDIENEIKFNYALSAAFSQRVYNNIKPVENRAAENVKASMVITDEITNVTDTLSWFLSIDEDIVSITSNMTQMLKPSTYSFKLSIATPTSNYYYGELNNIEILDGDQKNIEIPVKPVLYRHLYGSLSELSSMNFKYDKDEIATFSDPKIGFILNGAEEQILELNSEGESDVYLNIPDGNHTLSLKLYDGNVQKGKSDINNETINVELNTDIEMNILPLSGEISLTTPIGTDTMGIFNINVPSEIIDKVGGVENLKTVLQISGPQSGSIQSEAVVTQSQYGYFFDGTAKLDGVKEEVVTLSVTYMDKTKSDQIIGKMLYENANLASYLGSATVELYNRSIVTGDLLSEISLRAYTNLGEPINGAKVYVDEVLVGITSDEGTFGSGSCLKFYHTKGTVTIRVEDPSTGNSQSKVVDIDLLSTQTINIGGDYISEGTSFASAIAPIFDINATGQQESAPYIQRLEDAVARIESPLESTGFTGSTSGDSESQNILNLLS